MSGGPAHLSSRRLPPLLINVGWLPYSDQQKRNQAIFQHLVARQDLFRHGFFINPPRVGGRTMPLAQRLRHATCRPALSMPQPSITLLTTTYAWPFSWRRGPAAIQTALMVRRIRALSAGLPYVLWLNNPQQHPFLIAKALRGGATRTVLDLSDDFTTFGGLDAERIALNVQELLAWSDGLVAVNEHVANKFPHPRSIVFENATDFQNFQQVSPDFVLGDVLPKPRNQTYVGFAGGLYRERVDEQLLKKLFAALPHVHFLFVGPNNDPDLVDRINAHANARVLPSVPYSSLPSVIRSFDVAIVPHLDNALSRGNDLLKTRDYLACGIPVVSTPASNMSRFGSLVQIARTHDEFIGLVSSYLEGRLSHDPGPGLELARRESWEQTVPRLARWLLEEIIDGADLASS